MPLSLGEGPGRIEDVEALVRKVSEDVLRKWGARLENWRKDELVSYLIGVAWEVSGRYDPAKDKKPNLAAYVSRIVSFRVADWYRQTFGDTRHGEKPIVLSLDAPATLDSGYPDAEGADRLVDTLAASTGDPSVDRAPDLVRVLLDRGGSGKPGPVDPLGQPEAGGAAGGDRDAARAGQAGVLPAGRRDAGPRSPAALKKGRVPGTYRQSSRPPICPDCFMTFRDAFGKVNKHLPVAERLSKEKLNAKAAKRAQAVRFGKEWACPRCTKLENEEAQQLMLREAYTNRAQRRAGTKAHGLAKNRKKGPNKTAKQAAQRAQMVRDKGKAAA
jgi:hypothetical protein